MTYRDVEQNGWLLPERKKYTMRDVNALMRQGFEPRTARFIVLCSWSRYEDSDISTAVLRFDYRLHTIVR